MTTTTKEARHNAAAARRRAELEAAGVSTGAADLAAWFRTRVLNETTVATAEPTEAYLATVAAHWGIDVDGFDAVLDELLDDGYIASTVIDARDIGYGIVPAIRRGPRGR